MAGKAPGKSHRKGISLVKIMEMFSTDEAAEQWIIEQRWPDGPYCPHCAAYRKGSGKGILSLAVVSELHRRIRWRSSDWLPNWDQK